MNIELPDGGHLGLEESQRHVLKRPSAAILVDEEMSLAVLEDRLSGDFQTNFINSYGRTPTTALVSGSTTHYSGD